MPPRRCAGHEGEGVALEPRSLREPEEAPARAASTSAAVTWPSDQRRVRGCCPGRGRTRLERRLYRVEQGTDPVGERLSRSWRAGCAHLLEEGGQVADRGADLHQGGRDDEYRDPDHGGEERRIDDEDGQPAADAGAPRIVPTTGSSAAPSSTATKTRSTTSRAALNTPARISTKPTPTARPHGPAPPSFIDSERIPSLPFCRRGSWSVGGSRHARGGIRARCSCIAPDQLAGAVSSSWMRRVRKARSTWFAVSSISARRYAAMASARRPSRRSRSARAEWK